MESLETLALEQWEAFLKKPKVEKHTLVLYSVKTGKRVRSRYRGLMLARIYYKGEVVYEARKARKGKEALRYWFAILNRFKRSIRFESIDQFLLREGFTRKETDMPDFLVFRDTILKGFWEANEVESGEWKEASALTSLILVVAEWESPDQEDEPTGKKKKSKTRPLWTEFVNREGKEQEPVPLSYSQWAERFTGKAWIKLREHLKERFETKGGYLKNITFLGFVLDPIQKREKLGLAVGWSITHKKRTGRRKKKK